MNLDELQSVRSKERRTDSLQHLRDSFYEDVRDYLEGLKSQRDAAAERADDPFASPEVRQLTDEIESATEVVEAVYERRMGKLVKHASLVAAGMEPDDEGMTAEERELFFDLVDRIQENKRTVLGTIEGDVDDGDDRTTPPSPADPGAEGVSAAEAMIGADQPESATAGDPTEAGAAQTSGTGDRDGPADDVGPAGADPASVENEPSSGTSGRGSHADATERDEGASSEADDRMTLRITADVGEILGVDDRAYDLEREDVVALPRKNAEPLLEREAAERLE